MNKPSPEVIRWLVSSIVTFLSVFLITLGTQIGGMDGEAVSSSAVLSVFVVAVRAGVKAITEEVLKRISSRSI